MNNSRIKLSIVLPVFNEEKTLQILYVRIKKMLEAFSGESELIFIDDGSCDGSYDILKGLAGADKRVRVFRFNSNEGQCKALEKGFREARGEIIAQIDADLQTDPQDILRLVLKLNDGFDLVCGWRWRRRDPWHKVLKSQMGNYVQRRITKINLHDISCPLKVYRKTIVKGITFQNRYDIFFLPLIFSKHTDKMAEVKIEHHPRCFGKSKYGFISTCLGVMRNYLRLIVSNGLND
ncbi:MAG: glycosyltransferase family 2 protein [Candidatus Omnitrophota bacterium]